MLSSEDSILYRLYVLDGNVTFSVVRISSPSVSAVGATVTLLGALYTVTVSTLLRSLCVVMVIFAVPALTACKTPSAVTLTIFLLLLLKLYAATGPSGSFTIAPFFRRS